MKNSICIIIGTAFTIAVGWLCAYYTDEGAQPMAVRPMSIVQQRTYEMPDVYELQELLFVQGYYAGPIDGICGRGTLDAWAKYSCDKAANKMSNN